jgi:hypothetical protein
LKTPRNAKGKQKSLLHEECAELDPGMITNNPSYPGLVMYDRERKWLIEYIRELGRRQVQVDAKVVVQETAADVARRAKEVAHTEALANGGGMECGCCFGEEIWVSIGPLPLFKID